MANCRDDTIHLYPNPIDYFNYMYTQFNADCAMDVDAIPSMMRARVYNFNESYIGRKSAICINRFARNLAPDQTIVYLQTRCREGVMEQFHKLWVMRDAIKTLPESLTFLLGLNFAFVQVEEVCGSQMSSELYSTVKDDKWNMMNGICFYSRQQSSALNIEATLLADRLGKQGEFVPEAYDKEVVDKVVGNRVFFFVTFLMMLFTEKEKFK